MLGESHPSPPLASRDSFGDSPSAKGAGATLGWLKATLCLWRAFEKPKTGSCRIFPIGHPRGAGHGAWGSLGRVSHMEKGPLTRHPNQSIPPAPNSLSAAGMGPAFPGTGTPRGSIQGNQPFSAGIGVMPEGKAAPRPVPNPSALHLQRALLIPFPTCSRHSQQKGQTPQQTAAFQPPN